MPPKASRMGSVESDQPSGKGNAKPANLVIVTEGGAIVSDRENVPRREVVEEMLRSVPAEVRALVGRISLSTYPKTSVHSNEATSERIQQFANALRRITDKTAQNIIALTDTIRAPDYAAATSRAVSPASMELKSSCSGREAKSIILACAQASPYEYPTDAPATLANAISLSGNSELEGKGGLLYKDDLFALPGLQRTGEPTSFSTRFNRLAWKERGHWYFGEDHPSHAPIGDEGVNYQLNSGVHMFDIGGEAEQVLSAVRGAKEGGLKGMILRSTCAANGNLLESHADVLTELDTEQIPGIVIGTSLREHDDHDVATENHPFEHITHGGGLTETEASLLMAEWLATAESMGLESDEDRAGYIRQKLVEHPFRN